MWNHMNHREFLFSYVTGSLDRHPPETCHRQKVLSWGNFLGNLHFGPLKPFLIHNCQDHLTQICIFPCYFQLGMDRVQFTLATWVKRQLFCFLVINAQFLYSQVRFYISPHCDIMIGSFGLLLGPVGTFSIFLKTSSPSIT